ncbi:MFS transporter [Vibrio sp. UCD-FRSSP16_10]|uniref:multidrug effflux MFS transporter n=1 Tax=unclassified Vibrio TaxID=2614977 RepID=UPI000801E2B8|nr:MULTISPECIES: multidrug effflux MFS transporter [unclassified Vibrio]OBT13989.1 MFS transporter [Vibrio sp. UCD-FRSSP16_30]OBT22870.1 MFS transporter [Vibrio sp. UCD-FRSSP16_10]
MTHLFRKKPIFLACLIISIGQFSMGLVFPSLPWIAKDFNISLDQAQLLVSIYLLGFGPSQFIYGPVSDALGRKKVLLCGLILAMLGLVFIIVFADSFHAMILGRFLQGLGTGCCAVLARATTRDSYTGDQLPTALSYIAMAASLTPLASPVIGGFINHYFGWGMVFITLLCYVAVAWLALMMNFKETMHHRKEIPSPKVMYHQYKGLLKSKYFVSFSSIAWLNFSLVVTTISLMPFIMQNQIGMTSDTYALWALIPTAGMLIGASLSNRLRSLIGIHNTLKIAPFVHIFSAIWLISCPIEPLWLMIGQLFLVLGNGLAMPCAQAMIMQPYSKRAGVAAAMSGGGQMIVSSLVSMALMNMGLSQVWQLGCVIAVFALITSLNIHRGFKAEVPQG